MKNFCLIVSLRLALFPLIFNLSFAQEDANNNPGSVSMTDQDGNGEQNENEVEPGLNGMEDTQDSSASPQNDKQISPTPLYQEGQNSQENGESFSLFPLDKGDTALAEGIGEEDANNNPGSVSMTDQDGNGEQNENEVEHGLNGEEAPQNDEKNTQKSFLRSPLLKSPEPQNEDLPNLKITEVYRLGTTEWIEITNISDKNFSGKISLSGVKQKGSIYDTKKINIPAYGSVIISDKLEIGVENDDIIVINNAQLTIDDSSALNIELQYSGNTIDSFNVDESTVGDLANNYKNKTPRPSFQKVYNGNRDNIQITTTEDIYNISGFIANPGKLIIESGNPWIGVGPSNPDDPLNISENGSSNETGSGDNPGSGDLTGGSSDFNLIVSEVFYDGEDEWIEIYNIGSGDFLGDLELSGNIFADDKINYIYENVQIPANSFLIIADSDEMFQNINVLKNGQTYPEFSIPDDQKIQIFLILSGEEVDSFYAHESRVNKWKGYGISFHKILTTKGLIVSRAAFSEEYDWVNISPSFEDYITATPGKLSTTSENTVKDYSKPFEDSSTSDDSDEDECGDVWEDVMTVSEIFWGGNRYNSYVEFSIHEDMMYYYDSLLLSGSLLEQPITMNLKQKTETFDKKKLQKNTRLILTTEPGALAEAGLITIILQPEFKLSSYSGELELYGIDGQSRQLLDIVKIGAGAPEKSTYHAGFNHYCGARMDNVMDFSPGFDESALKFFSATSQYNEKVVEVVKYVGGGGGCSCPSKAELCGTGTENAVQTGNIVGTGNTQDSSLLAQNDEQDTQELHPNPLLLGEGIGNVLEGQIKIVSLEPKTPESITLQSFLPYNIDFKNHSYYLKTSTSDSKKYIDGILYSNTIDTFSKNFGFVDGGACVYLYSGDSTLDSYCYSSEKTEKEQKEEKTDSFNPSDYQISITHIDYDPDGTDSGNETITIQSNSSKALDLSKIKMKVNATTKKITGTLEPNSILTLKGSFGFPNSTKDGSDVVVILFYDNHIFSTYTYNPNKPKIEIPDGAVKVYSVIDGDTFRYRKEDGSLQSVRLLGVDAPESNTARYRSTECFGKEAKNYLTNLIKNQYITLEIDTNSASSDAYGRMLAYVYLDGKLVNETLIAEGYAKEYTYKTAYSQQSAFRQAEENAKKSEKGLRSSSTCGISIAEEPEAWGIDYEKLSIKISNVIYDPDGTDGGNEIVELNVDNSQISAVTSVDFSDDFSLTIFPRSEYATGTTKNKKLSEFGLFDLSESSNITLKGNFGLPNNRATCVSLNQGSYTFDTRCYNPNGPLSEEEIALSGDTLTFTPNVKIQSIIPNPSGKDSGKEEITLLRTPSEESPDLLNLSPDFSLLINDKTKKKLVGNLIPNQNITIKGSFSFPNSASCVSLLYKGEELDKFCYSKASDGVKFNSDNTSLHEIPAEELAIVKKITLVKRGDKLCISYNKTLFSCKSIPNSTTEKNKKQLSMQNTFISELEKYIKSNYSSIYYNSEIKDYFNLYSEAKKAIKSGSGDFTRNDSNISITNISSLFQTEYEEDAKDFFIEQIQGILPENLSLALLQAEDEYNKKQVQKSDLSFLSMVN